MPVMDPPPSSSSYVTEPLLISKKAVRARPLFDPPIVKRAIRDSFAKLHPRLMMKNPVKDPKASDNPWEATTLEWTTATPPPHDNFGGRTPVVNNGPYEYSVPGAPRS